MLIYRCFIDTVRIQKMFKSACNALKQAVVSSAAFIAVGVLLVLSAQLPSLSTTLSAIITYLGFFSVLSGILLIAITGFAVMLPKINRQLELCQH